MTEAQRQYALRLRELGNTYRLIAAQLGVSYYQIQRLFNPERVSQASRDSVARYKARGSVAIVDMSAKEYEATWRKFRK